MRLWHYALIPVLPDKMLISQLRDCIAIKRQWEKGTLKHRLVSYVMDYKRKYFRNYVCNICIELSKRKIKIQGKYLDEIFAWCEDDGGIVSYNLHYPEHNDRYLIQCYYNLEEKYDRGIIKSKEFIKISKLVGGMEVTNYE